MKPETKKLLADMAKTHYGRALRDFLDVHYASIGNIMESKSWEETLGRKFALTLLRELFAFMEEKKNTGVDRSQYT